MTTPNRRTVWQVVIAAMVIVAIAGIALVGGAAVFFFRHFQSESVSADDADSRIAAVRSRFAGQRPLVRIDADGNAAIAGRSDGGAHPPLVTLHALVYDDGDGELVNISIPFWLLRLAPDGRVSFDSNSGLDFDAERLNLNVSALEAVGPGLVLDHADANGTKLIVWTE
jgi:hypothetical protein